MCTEPLEKTFWAVITEGITSLQKSSFDGEIKLICPPIVLFLYSVAIPKIKPTFECGLNNHRGGRMYMHAGCMVLRLGTMGRFNLMFLGNGDFNERVIMESVELVGPI